MGKRAHVQCQNCGKWIWWGYAVIGVNDKPQCPDCDIDFTDAEYPFPLM